MYKHFHLNYSQFLSNVNSSANEMEENNNNNKIIF